MNTSRTTAVMTGVLFIAATVLNVPGNTLTKAILNAPDYLTSVSTSADQVVIGALLVLMSAFASAGIAISLYPVLRKHHEALALASVGFRLVEAVFYIVAVVCLLSLLTLSQEYVKAATPDASLFLTSGAVLLGGKKWAGEIGVIAFGLSALMYYSVFYQSRLIPRWLSGWGILGASLSLATALLTMFGRMTPLSTDFVLLNLPIGLQELVLAVWLIVKGFNLPAVAADGIKSARRSPASQPRLAMPEPDAPAKATVL